MKQPRRHVPDDRTDTYDSVQFTKPHASDFFISGFLWQSVGHDQLRDSTPGVVSSVLGDCLQAGKSLWYVTSH